MCVGGRLMKIVEDGR